MDDMKKVKSICVFRTAAAAFIGFTMIFNASFSKAAEPGDIPDAKKIMRDRISSITIFEYRYKQGREMPDPLDKKVFRYDSSGELVESFFYDARNNLDSRHVSKYNKSGKKIKTIDYRPDGTPESGADYFYDSNENLVRELNYCGGGIDRKFFIRYNQGGKICEKSCFRGDGTPDYKYLYEYDKNGMPVREISYDSGGEIEYKRLYIYDAVGRVTWEAVYSKNIYDSYKIKYRYDEIGNKTLQEHSRIETGMVFMKTAFKYDARKNLIEETDFFEPSGCRKHVLKYDGLNNKIEEAWYNSETGAERKLFFKYDKNGNLVEETARDHENSVIYMICYKYDGDGNIFEKVRYGTGGQEEPESLVKYLYTHEPASK